tara:strand:- start:949 stop:1521 length:573 start_codon:yes stop_codon:yes gene_type:complete
MPRSPEQFAQIREERKEQILQAALEIFAQESYHKASMASVALRAKVSKGLIYNYFRSKDEILATIIGDIMTEAMDGLDLDETKPLTREKFIQLIEKSIDMTVENPVKWKLYTSLSLQPDVTPLMMKEVMPKALPIMKMVSDYFEAQGHEDPVATMRYYSAVLDGVQIHLLLDTENFPVEKVKQMMIKQFA